VSSLAPTRRAALAACRLVIGLVLIGLAPGASLAQDSDAARIKKLETEVANLRLMVGTLESLVRTAPGTAMAPEGSTGPAPSYLEPRVRALDTQIAALTTRVEQMGRQVKALEAKLDAKLDAAPEAAKIGVLTSRVERMGQKVSALQSKLVAAPEPVATGASSGEVDALGKKVAALETKLEATPNPATIESLAGRIKALDEKMSALEARLDAMPKAASAPKHATPAPQAEAPKDVASEEGPAAAAAVTPRPTIMPEPAKQEPVKQEAAVPEPAEPKPAEPETAMSAPAPVMPKTVIDRSAETFDPTKPRWYGPRPGEDADAPQSITPPAATGALPRSFAALPNENAQALYEQGYGDFLQRDYPAAQRSFSKLVKAYPNDPLAGSAQYWAGETYYVRKQYKKAADTFLAGYRKYSGSDKAPDTLLRLGMSLAALGQNNAACSTFKELKDKFPDAPESIRDQAKGEAGKAGCAR